MQDNCNRRYRRSGCLNILLQSCNPQNLILPNVILTTIVFEGRYGVFLLMTMIQALILLWNFSIFQLSESKGKEFKIS